jgi:hypothetical protein
MEHKEESKIENKQNNQKEFKPYEEKGKIYDDNVIFKGELPIKFNEFDPQKGGMSPKILFRKRKSEDTSIYFKKNKNGEDILDPTIKKETRIKNAFEALLDYVREVYFTNVLSANDDNVNNNSDCFKFTSLDLLINPLRKSYPWETWSPYEIALFNCCICKFGTNFDLYLNIITTKKKEEVIDFYYTWKSSKYYKMWKNKKKRSNS